MPLFWLTYKHGDDVEVIIQPARHLIEARLRAQVRGQDGTFGEGQELDTKTAAKIPKKLIGRSLNSKEAATLLGRLA